MTPYDDNDEAQFIECKVWQLNVTEAVVNAFEILSAIIFKAVIMQRVITWH